MTLFQDIYVINPLTQRFLWDSRDRLGLSVPHRTCRSCRQLYICRGLREFYALECPDCRDERLHGHRPIQDTDQLW